MDYTNANMEAYNEYADNYEKKFMDYKPYIDKISEFAQKIRGGSWILDIGCGPGHVSKLLNDTISDLNITGVDFSENMIRLARRNLPQGNFICNDMRSMCFEDESFDAVILSFCIVHPKNEETEALVTKAAKCLKTDGEMYVSFMEGKKSGLETTSFSEKKIFFNYYESSEVERILKNNRIHAYLIKKEPYPEPDGTLTTDIFMYCRKDA